MFYVIDKRKAYVTHQADDKKSCTDFINNVEYLHGIDRINFTTVQGAKERDKIIKELKGGRR